ncbi:MAG: hormogonium polysaccharide biosynthesis protein HpsA [Cyanobacteriota bacterium]|nr:hormogonium polysaccharide biosynthesis protein HpsA [Cyanobacteriota bacterium]
MAKLPRRIGKSLRKMTESVIKAILRDLVAAKNKGNLSTSGFVLPTVTMVMLVVVLLTIAMSLRSFDRAQDARNVRVNQALLSASTPALDRARAKIEYLLREDPSLPSETPQEDTLYDALIVQGTTDRDEDYYTFGDEKRLQISFDIDDDGSIEPDGGDTETDILENDEVITTAWRFPVDTDNNGKYDSFSLYGIFLRSPQRDETTGNFSRSRSPLDARTPPMPPVELSALPGCENVGTSSSLVGDSGWYQSAGKLKKSFFVYTATVPITNKDQTGLIPSGDADKYENYKGTTGISALEYQQDWTRIPLTNNSVVYEDDLEIAPGKDFTLNGRIHTNSNLIASPFNNIDFELYQVSSPNSCFYEAENSKIVVGGNVINGMVGDTVRNSINVHLFGGSDPSSGAPQISSSNQSVNETAIYAAYNTEAYSRRIDALVAKQLDNAADTDPESVQIAMSGGKTREEALEEYFRERTRKVTFAEVGPEETETLPATLLYGSGDTLRPPVDWILPTETDTTDATLADVSGAGRAELAIKRKQLAATDPEELEEEETEYNLGDRVKVGNNLPQKWWNDEGDKFLTSSADQYYDQGNADASWYDKNGNQQNSGQRYRNSQVITLADVGALDRDGFWEVAAATEPEAPLDGIGGLRVITGAGVYERRNSFLPPPDCKDCTRTGTTVTYDAPDTSDTEAYEVVWQDTMPMSPVRRSKVYDNQAGAWVDTVNDWTETDWNTLPTPPSPELTNTIDPKTRQFAKGDLRMRATAVYHYAQDPGTKTGDPQAPVACISSYYDPSDNETARNQSGLADVSGWNGPDYLDPTTPGTVPANARSNNGIVYGPPPSRPSAAATYNSSTGLFSGTGDLGLLAEQANMVFPDGRFVNETLRNALKKDDASRTLAEQAAVDTTLCAFGILDETIDDAPDYIPDGTIKEITLLNAREVKAIEADDPSTDTDETFTLTGDAALEGNYDLPLEERQPMEIRVTQLDLNQMRQKEVPFKETTIVGPQNSSDKEYLLPYSGIIYASRDDGLPDASDESELVSASDYKLDPTRRPNGIMLINGEKLGRFPEPSDVKTEDVVKEKGLTLVSNEPVYIQGDFNLHQETGTEGGVNPLEEFTDELEDDWSVNFYTRDTLEPKFACRKGDPRLNCGSIGDEWRVANVLADSVTLLSKNYRPGFRHEGGFDLRNNEGNSAVVAKDAEGKDITAKQARRFNGFMANDFAINGLSSGHKFTINGSDEAATETKDANEKKYVEIDDERIDSSYFTNFVTPVQRRITGTYPVYLMEMCLKVPVSSCAPDDWVVGYDSDITLKANHPDIFKESSTPELTMNYIRAGTTGRFNGRYDDLANKKSDDPSIERYDDRSTRSEQRFARRIAFKRNEYNLLELSTTDSATTSPRKYTAIPLGVDYTDSQEKKGKINAYEYPNVPPAEKTFVLWFRTTTNTDGRPYCFDASTGGCTASGISYAKEEPLFYLPPNFDGEWDLPEFNTVKWENWPLLPNTPTISQISDPDNSLADGDNYAVCESGGDGFEGYDIDVGVGSLTSGCDSTAISNFVTAIDDPNWSTIEDGSGSTLVSTDTNGDGLIAFDLTANPTIGTITITGDSNSIFLIRRSGNTNIGGSGAVTLDLEGGVDPNKIFWFIKGDLIIQNSGTQLAGNFVGDGSGEVTINDNAEILGGRFLGFNNASGINGSTEVYAMTTQAQPVVVPVLQIHEPDAKSAGSTPGGNDPKGWILQAKETEYNVVMGTRDLPSRPGDNGTDLTTGEHNGGLQNLPRFQGDWRYSSPAQAAEIKGAFIQLGRSKYSTAPYQQVFDNARPSSAFLGDFPTKYQSGNLAQGLNGYQGPPNRKWGFDVGLLSQSPDLFAQKFTLPPTDSKPSEYFREVSRDDDWVKGLLCADIFNESAEAINRPSSVDCTAEGYDD